MNKRAFLPLPSTTAVHLSLCLQPQPRIIDLRVDPESTIKILLATDNHIGYNERDPIRGQDSINAFKEILQLAVKHDVSYENLARDVAFTLLRQGRLHSSRG